MVLTASAGFFVPIFEAAAAAIATGVVLGFAGATAGVTHDWSRKQVESHALRDGYIGAVAVLGFWVLDLCIVYAAST